MVTWMSAYGREFHLSVRRLNYSPNGTIIFGKRRKAVVNFISVAIESSEVGWQTRYATFTAQIGLIKHLSYEIQLADVSLDGAYNLTASVFLDARGEFAVGKSLNRLRLT